MELVCVCGVEREAATFRGHLVDPAGQGGIETLF